MAGFRASSSWCLSVVFGARHAGCGCSPFCLLPDVPSLRLSVLSLDHISSHQGFYMPMVSGSADYLSQCCSFYIIWMVNDDGRDGGFQSPWHIGLGVYAPDRACFGATAGSHSVVAHTFRTDHCIFKFGGSLIAWITRSACIW